MRMRFRTLAASARPSSQNVADGDDIAALADTSMTDIVTSLRGTPSHEQHGVDETEEWVLVDAPAPAPPSVSHTAERKAMLLKPRSLLKRKSE